MRRIRPGFQTIERNKQQRTHLLDWQRPFKQVGEEKITPAILAQAAINEILHSGTGNDVDAANQAFGQALASEDGGIDSGGLQQSIGQGGVRLTGHRR
jgi:hypothetical protein